VGAGGIANEGQASPVSLQRATTAAQELDGGPHVVDRLRVRSLAVLDEPVVDREENVAPLGEIGPPVLVEAGVPDLPAAPVHGHDRRIRPRASGSVEIADEADTVVRSIFQATLQLASHGFRPPRNEIRGGLY